MQVSTYHACNSVVRLAHDGKDVPMTGPAGQGAQSAGGEADGQGVRGLPFPDDGGPVVIGLYAVENNTSEAYGRSFALFDYFDYQEY